VVVEVQTWEDAILREKGLSVSLKEILAIHAMFRENSVCPRRSSAWEENCCPNGIVERVWMLKVLLGCRSSRGTPER